MGSNRDEHQNKSPTQVHYRLTEVFNVRKKDLYRVWLAYNNWVVLNKNSRVTIGQLKSHPDVYDTEVLDYFMALGFELFNKAYLEEVNAK